MDVDFLGREKGAEPWTLIVLPDTQKYTEDASPTSNIFLDQAEWIVANKEALNIQMVVHEGDVVEDWDSTTQWAYADEALTAIIDADIPLLVVPGNHDHSGYSTTGITYCLDSDELPSCYSGTLPSARFEALTWWDDFDSYPDPLTYPDNDYNNNYVTLLSIGNDDYLFLGLDFCPSSDEIAWANSVLSDERYSNHKAILTTHGYITDNGGLYSPITHCTGGTEYIFNNLVAPNDNLKMVLCGHMHNDDGEFHRTVTRTSGATVHEVMADYQARANGGNGLLRIMTFYPANDEIVVQTYSPYTDTYETDADSAFTLPFDMDGGEPFTLLGTASAVTSGDHATHQWNDLAQETTYEWYVEVTGTAGGYATSSVWELTTGL
jgi:hypothetical protein